MRARPEGRVVLLGATGEIGRLTASAMVRQGLAPVLTASDEVMLADLAEQLRLEAPSGHAIEYRTVDAAEPGAVRDLLTSTGDVLVDTAGPFPAEGDAAIGAAVDARCGYLDCAWEPSFLRRVFEHFGPLAAAESAVLLPAFGCHYVAGALAAMIAVRRTMTGSRPPARVDVGYFVTEADGRWAPRHALVEDSFRWTGGRLRTERPGTRVRSFDIGAGRSLEALSLGTAEHLTVPRLVATISEVNAYVGWFGRMTRAAAVAGAVGGARIKVPLLGDMWETMVRGIGGGGSASPDTGHTYGRTLVVAETFDADGNFQQRVRVEGPMPQELTAALLSWGAGMLLQGVEAGVGVLGPVDAFGMEALIGGCMALGLAEAHHRV